MIEGEGSIGAHSKGRHTPRLAVTNTTVETIATLLRFIGTGNVCFIDRGAARWWQFSVNRVRDMEALLPQIIPYLTGKQERASGCLAFLQSGYKEE